MKITDSPSGSGAYKLVEADVTTIGGSLPVNTSGGLKAKVIPRRARRRAVRCTVRAASGEAVKQVDGARIGLAHNIGRPTTMSAVTILEGAAHGAR